MEIPEGIKPFFVEWKILKYNGKEYQYAIVKKEYALKYGAPEIFALVIGNFYCLSDAYPEKWREAGILHEFLEYEVGVDQSDEFVCMKTTQKELEIAAGSFGYEIKEYISFRIKFLDDIADFNKEGNPLLYQKIQHSIRYLKAIMPV
jgi:hypothetical protein